MQVTNSSLLLFALCCCSAGGSGAFTATSVPSRSRRFDVTSRINDSPAHCSTQKVVYDRVLVTWAKGSEENENDDESETEEGRGMWPFQQKQKEQLSEEEASRRVMNRLMFPTYVGNFFRGAAWSFVLIGFILNIFGYDYVRDEQTGFIRIDTMEVSQFQREVRKSVRESKNMQKQQSPTPTSAIEKDDKSDN